ncbi:hypothetical protein AYK26_03745 [Euryarchaeota archaeon SM23-78]|nr:MAG: hypothetical protein AYK26_03745 [Euryarchaeota archaeon SM23-78]MBW3000668.1 hypothetical protein [Candidatus Woesearchaeota archaeon]
MDKIKFETFSDDLVGCLLKAMKDIYYLKEIGLPDLATLRVNLDDTFICGGQPEDLNLNFSAEQERDYELIRTNLDALQKHYAKKKSISYKKLSDAEFNLFNSIVSNLNMYTRNERVVAAGKENPDF